MLILATSVALMDTKGQTQFSGWQASLNVFKISRPFSIHLDVQTRSTDQWEHVSTFIFRPGLNWHFRKNMIATAGYGYILNRTTSNSINGYLPEHRIWQQFIINHPLSSAAIAHRFRLEQRFIPKVVTADDDLKKNGHSFAHRLRYFTRGVIAFNGRKVFEKGMFGAAQNEVFLNLGNKTAVNGRTFDQNRAYLAIGYRFSSKFDLEAGYVNQYISGRNKAIRNNHVAQLASYLRL